jgi:2'-5' RNA ligase
MSTFILTARIDEIHQSFFDDLRNMHFPKERNFLRAHLTLFHTLPKTAEILEALQSVEKQSIVATVSSVKNIGHGVAYFISSEQLENVHRKLKKNFERYLSLQDQQKFKPHITIQNKVRSDQAKALFDQLNPSFEPFELTISGLDLWLYLNGPWEHTKYFPFS